MKIKINVLIMVCIMLFSMPVWAEASGGGDQNQTKLQDQDQTKLQDQEQTKLDQEVQDQARLQLKDRLQISDSARTQQQDRLQLQDQTQSFADVQQHWAREQITSAYNWGFVNGYQNGDFDPNGDISGAEGIIMASRMINCMNNTDNTSNANAEIDLDAVPVWARETIQEQTALRIAAQSQVYGETQLNRLQFAVMLAKALSLEPTTDLGDTVVFLDQDSISKSDLGYIDVLRTLGIIEGSNGSFNPGQLVTRAEAASMLMRVVDSIE